MDKFLCIQAFVRVAETESFATAARQLGVTPSVITSRIKQLEKFVQAPLFHRSTRKVALSETAVAYFDECVELLARIESITDRMQLIQDMPAGLLRLQVLPGFALGPFAQALHAFNIENPNISLDITVSAQPENPIEGGYDVSLQLFRPTAEVLIERRIFPVRRVFCASPAYIARFGKPERPTDLLNHRMALYSAYPARNRWVFKHNDVETSIDLSTRLTSNSNHLLRDFAVIGGGISCLPTVVCSEALLRGSLIPLLLDYQLPVLELLAIYPITHRRTVKVKLFIDFIRKRFAGEPEWDRALRNSPEFAGMIRD